MERTYISIDLKSFYASVECVERGLNPLTTNLVVADESRTEKTICLAVSPSLKQYGIPGRARLFEVIQKVNEVNTNRKVLNNYNPFKEKSYDANKLKDNNIELSFITAVPRMSLYMKYSTKIYKIYLKYVAPEDIHVYSIDEVFMDVTNYIYTNKISAKEMAMQIIQEVLKETGITATAGIGTNMYLCKVAMDIVAKHIPADENGVRIAELDEQSYREQLWTHRPLTDFWRVGRGYAKKLEANGLFTMGDIAKCSIGKPNEFYNEALLYKLFGINAELLIDHAWGWEPCTIQEVKSYQPSTNSLSTGQVLPYAYDYEHAKLIVKEMTELLVLDLVEKEIVTDQIVLTIGYDIDNVTKGNYKGEITTDFYGRKVPKHAHGTGNIGRFTSSTKLIMQTTVELFERIINPDLLVRRVTICANHICYEKDALITHQFEQLSLFTDYQKEQKTKIWLKKEKNIQHAMLNIQKRYGKNAILKGLNLQEGAKTIERNAQVGGHRA